MSADNQPSKTSRVGKRPIDVPKGVTVTIAGDKVSVKGPKGSLERTLVDNVSIARDGDSLVVSSVAPGRNGARLQGMTRALVANMVHGCSEGYSKTLELHGTGYRAEVKGNVVHCNLGFSGPKPYELPAGVSVEIPKDSKGQRIIISGADKEKVGQAAASIRAFRPPEPYGGKGVRYQGERIREKAGKAGK